MTEMEKMLELVIEKPIEDIDEVCNDPQVIALVLNLVK